MSARQQQRPRRAFPKPGGEQRRPADFGRHDRLDLVGVEHEQIGAGRPRPGVDIGIGQPHHDPVVGGGRLLVHAVAFGQPSAHRQGQRAVHPQPVRRVQDHPPIAELVAEPFHQQGGVGGHRGRGGALIVEQPPQVLGGIVVETQLGAPFVERRATQAGQLPGERADRGAQLGGPPDVVAAPERQPGRLAGGGDHQHPVVGDLGDPPAGRPQRDDIAGTRLVDHLFVEFPDPGRFFRRQVHGEQSAVRDRAAGGDRQPLRARTRGQRPGVAVVDQPGA
ncbi:hypothetical protein C1Y40_04115 [Mycobacterium talmoniae]|uniref:Uncharacterized protein n=1 Tax=Mycobacterium talmoniae TaxID=1858794 RepID=A0A2S8BGH5_9MYCO|nr:hypothetical protein C1Y40_04115 [Mycobacterium talmoniae]